MRDLIDAIRTLRRSPGYTFTCVVVLALGIGANGAIFSVINSVILKPLPYPDPTRLVMVWERFPNMPDPPGSRLQATHSTFEAWKQQNTVFSEIGAFRDKNLNETGTERPDHVETGFASASLFPMLGVRPSRGRLFDGSQERKGSDQVAILSDAFFESHYHRDPSALGRPLTLEGASYTIIGVLPPRFHLPALAQGLDQMKPEVWVPLSRLWNSASDEVEHQLFVAARIRQGATLEQARQEMSAIEQRLSQQDPKYNKGFTASVFPFDVEDTSPTLHRALYVLLGAVGILLLMACANLANMTLARASVRTREISIRMALGATRMRVVRQLIMEPLLVSVVGAAAGLLLAQWCIPAMLSLKPPDIQRPEFIHVDWVVFVFAAALSLVATLLFGLAPAIVASSSDLNTALKAAGGRGGSAARLRGRQFLIAVEVALALILVAGAGLMLRSFYQLVSEGVGFETGHLLTIELNLPAQRYATDESRSRFFHSLLDRARALPGVVGATVVDNLPLHQIRLIEFNIAGRPEPPLDALPLADVAHVDPQFFRVLGLKLPAGRTLTDVDLAQSEHGGGNAAVVNETFVHKFFPNENPIGRQIITGRKQRFEIVGVVSDFTPVGTENGKRPEAFFPDLRMDAGVVVLRTRSAPDSYSKGLEAAVASIDRDLPADQVRTMDYYNDDFLAQRKFNTLLIGIFAGLALALAAIGIYGVLSNLVASRVREIGIRMAIGATPAEIGRLILRQGMLPVTVGLVIGMAATFALSQLLQALLFRVTPRDPVTLGVAAIAILVVSPLALLIPLRRATAVDCTVALREE